MSRTFRLRHMPSLGAKKFVDGRLSEYEEKADEELYGNLAHQWYNFPCFKDQEIKYFHRYARCWRTRKCDSHEECLEYGLVGFGSISSGPWKFFRLMRNRILRNVTTVWNHPIVWMGAGHGKKKGYRVRNNRDYRRVVRAAERKALMEDEEVVFPIYKKHVLWDMW